MTRGVRVGKNKEVWKWVKRTWKKSGGTGEKSSLRAYLLYSHKTLRASRNISDHRATRQKSGFARANLWKLPRLKRSSTADQTVDRRRNGKRLVKTTDNGQQVSISRGSRVMDCKLQMVLGWNNATKEEFLPFGPGRSGVMSWLIAGNNI